MATGIHFHPMGPMGPGYRSGYEVTDARGNLLGSVIQHTSGTWSAVSFRGAGSRGGPRRDPTRRRRGATSLAEGALMARGVEVPVKTLSPAIRDALKSVKYGARDIRVEPATEVRLDVGGGAGQKGFSMLVDLETGRHQTMYGSWGGANMFNPQNRVDLDRTVRPLPPGTVLIQGSIGYPRTFAHIEAHPDTLGSLSLAAPKVEITPSEKRVLTIHSGIKSSYRAEEYRRHGIGPRQQAEVIDALVAKGLLSRNKIGQTTITTAGKNAAHQLGEPGYYRRRRRTTTPRSHAAKLRRSRGIR